MRTDIQIVEIVDIFHGIPAADAAAEHFRTVFQRRKLPDDMPGLKLAAPISVIDHMTDAGLVATRSEVRRLAQQGGLNWTAHKLTTQRG